MHHIAFTVADDDVQMALREALMLPERLAHLRGQLIRTLPLLE